MTNLSPDLSEELEGFKKIFATQITESWTLTKNPPRLKSHYKDAQQGKDKTAQVFLKAGFFVWLAYFRTKLLCEGGQHYNGQKADQDTFSSFRQLCIEKQEAVATALSHTEVHHSVQTAGKRMHTVVEDQPSQRKRQRTSQSGRMTTSTSEDAVFSNHAQDISISTTTSAPSNLALENAHETDLSPLAFSEIPNCQTEPTDAHNFPSPKSARLTGLFSEYLHGAILKDGDIANITINFSLSLDVSDGHLCLVIVPSRVHFLAMKLLGKNVESTDKQRYIVDENGRKIVPDPSLKLECATADALPEFLGPLLLSGIAESTKRKVEIRDGNSFTECLSMRISCNPRDSGYLYVTLGSSTLFSVYMQCLGQF